MSGLATERINEIKTVLEHRYGRGGSDNSLQIEIWAIKQYLDEKISGIALNEEATAEQEQR